MVLANGSMSSKQSGEGQIRAAMVEADLVACMIALPPQLFRTTQIPACLWFLAKDKTTQGAKALTDRRDEVLFIDARKMGVLENRTERIPHTGGDRADRGRVSCLARHGERMGGESDVLRTCRVSATPLRSMRSGSMTTFSRRAGTSEPPRLDESDCEPIVDMIERLKKELFVHFEESARLEQEVRTQLERLDV